MIVVRCVDVVSKSGLPAFPLTQYHVYSSSCNLPILISFKLVGMLEPRITYHDNRQSGAEVETFMQSRVVTNSRRAAIYTHTVIYRIQN